MLSEKMQKALNDQVMAEMYSGNLYIAMSAYFEEESLSGFGHWMRAQAQEEYQHAMSFYKHITDRDGRVRVGAVEAPPESYESPLDVFQKTVEHEEKVTKMVHNLVALAREEKDYAAEVFLQAFVSEQVEEEKTAKEIRDMLKLIGEKGHALMALDGRLAQR
jgi:ferritin